MENTAISKYTVSFGLSLALASVVNAILVVAKETCPTVMAGMQKLTGHHWVSHSAIVLILFAVLGWAFARAHGGRGVNISLNRLIATLVSAVAIGGLAIFGFYLTGG